MSIDRGPIPNSYVLLDGRLIAGEYPGDRRDGPAKAKLGALLDAGVRTFLDLTESHELAPYDSLLAAEAKARCFRSSTGARRRWERGCCKSVCWRR